MAGLKVGDRVRLTGTVPGVGHDVDGENGTVTEVDSCGYKVRLDSPYGAGRGRAWRFNGGQVHPIDDEPSNSPDGPSDSPVLRILGVAAQDVLRGHIELETRDDYCPVIEMSTGQLRSLVRRAKAEGVL